MYRESITYHVTMVDRVWILPSDFPFIIITSRFA